MNDTGGAAVAGAAALVLAEHPELTYQQVIDRLDGSVDRITSLSGKVATGGRLNIARAIESDTVSPGPLDWGSRSSPGTRSKCRFPFESRQSITRWP